jgi:RNA-binding protein
MESQPSLTGAQRKRLRGLAHSLEPIVHVGRGGITEEIVQEVRRCLLAHELIKVRLHDPEDKRVMAEMLAQESASACAGLVGHVVILYKRHPEKPRIDLSAE